MAHNIQHLENGEDAMFCVGGKDAAWHGLGQRCNEAVIWSEAMQLARLDWTVSKQPMFFEVPQIGKGKKAVPALRVSVPDKFAIVRSTDNAPLGVVGNTYMPIQNAKAFDFVDVLLGAEAGAHYESAGALGNGERIWCLARVPSADFSIGADKHESFLLFTTSHDGSEAADCKLTDIRVVCQNTLNMALSMKGSAWTRFRHTQNGVDKMEQAKKLLVGAVSDAQQLKAKFDKLVSRKLTRASFVATIDKLFPVPEGASADNPSPGIMAALTRRYKMLTDISQLFASNDEDAFPDQHGTAYALFNAVTDYVDHFKSAPARDGLTVNQNRAKSAMFGPGADFKSNALAAILEATEVEAPQADIDADVEAMLRNAGI